RPAPEDTKDEDCCVCYGVGVGLAGISRTLPGQTLNSRLTQIKLLRPMPTCPSCRGKLEVDLRQKDILEKEEVIGRGNNTNKWLVKLRSLVREWQTNNKMLRQQINGGFVIQQEVSQVPVVSAEIKVITNHLLFFKPVDLKFVCVPPTLSSSSENPAPQQLFSPAPSSPMTSFDYRDSVTPDELDIPEFKQYNKEKYESAKSGNRRRRKPTREECDTASSLDGYEEEDGNRQFYILSFFVSCSINKLRIHEIDLFEEIRRAFGLSKIPFHSYAFSSVSHAEFRRQIHIQSEQRRRAEIKDGFEQLRRQLPFNTNGRKMSKATLLQKTVAHLKNMKSKENFLFDEINRLHQYIAYLSAELEREKKYTLISYYSFVCYCALLIPKSIHSFIRMNAIYQQQETLDKIYAIGL
ncbi:14168_t:CDS:2, partial [Cetraspora pellucida]